MPQTLTPANCTDTYAAEQRAYVEQIEAAFSTVLFEIEHMPCIERRPRASTLYVEALVAYRAGNVDSAAVALHLARFHATGKV